MNNYIYSFLLEGHGQSDSE